jgi:hypothetical protein
MENRAQGTITQLGNPCYIPPITNNQLLLIDMYGAVLSKGYIVRTWGARKMDYFSISN